ncbi:hypothetical protein O3M35_013209 [Rhynocoris fuscipes]|uniref:ATP-dependent RNA helicase n=1 Tax=Rhynocoris fuscipes TaxID=488301 RepID=A0AAW1CJU5_9HEMI
MMENVQNDWLFYLQKHLDNQPISHLTLNHRINKISKYQKLLFSATLSTDAERLKKLNLFQPVLFAAMKHNQDTPSKFVMPEQLKQYYLIVEPYLKPAVIAELISGHKWRRVLCFCKSAVEADRLSNLISQLCPDIKVRDISSKIPNRVQLIHEFSVGHIDLLICTDIMGRGIDIPNVRHVISYDPAKHFKGYVHRAGRTARAGTEGTVLTLLSNDQANSFIQTLRHNNKVNINELELSELALEKKSKLMEKILQCFHGSTKASNTYTNSNKSKAKNRRPQIKQSIVL